MQQKTDIEGSSRRAVLKTFAATAAALPIFGQNPPSENHHSEAPVTRQAAAEYRYRYFRPEQLKTLDALTETIIPTDDHSSGARAARVSEYIDAIIGDAPQSAKELWSNGIATADEMAQNSFGKPYADCSAEEQVAIMSELVGNERESGDERKFFVALKRATIDGYYTSRIGIHEELQYQGDQALTGFPGCQHGEAL